MVVAGLDFRRPPSRRTAQNFRSFSSLSRHRLVVTVSLWGSSRRILVVFLKTQVTLQMCTFGALGLSCEDPSGPTRRGRRGSHTTARELQTCTFLAPRRFKTPPKFPRKRPKEREKKTKMVAGKGKKKREILGPPPCGSHPSGPHPFGSFGPPPVWGPLGYHPLGLPFWVGAQREVEPRWVKH